MKRQANSFAMKSQTDFKPEEKNQDNTYYRAQEVISQRISSLSKRFVCSTKI